MHYTTKELVIFVYLFKNSGKFMWEWNEQVWDNVGRNIKLDETEFISMSPLSGVSRLTLEV